jgi:urease beta subunit
MDRLSGRSVNYSSGALKAVKVVNQGGKNTVSMRNNQISTVILRKSGEMWITHEIL